MDIYDDLADEIGADDLLIPGHEISARKLIKRTPRYNIYKAEWFGHVLVYEPTSTQKQESGSSNKHPSPLKLATELNNLSVNWPETSSELAESSDYESEQIDSAYSSISSTPQYHTKSSSTEFEFSPEEQLRFLNEVPNKLSTSYTSTQIATKNERTSNTVTSIPPVLLNHGSFNYNGSCFHSDTADSTDDKQNNSSSWLSDLNELRMVAHENFILFLGASMEDEEKQEGSLVMQMNHPKSSTIYNLLHKSKFEPNSSPIDRFFASKRQQISLDVKFRICQQVTNAMAYLHDKNIVHGRITSGNIYVELNQRVKISLIDIEEHSLIDSESPCCEDGVKFHLPSLTYLSPEFIKTITVIPTKTAANHHEHQNNFSGSAASSCSAQVNFGSTLLTKEADVFSFGTFLFELFTESFPFADQIHEILWLSRSDCLSSPLFLNNPPPNNVTAIKSPFQSVLEHQPKWNGDIQLSAGEIIYQIGAGNIAAKNLSAAYCHKDKRFPFNVRRIVEHCWNTSTHLRPSFKQLEADFLTL